MKKHGLGLLCYTLMHWCFVTSALATPADNLVRELSDSVLRVQVNLANGKNGLGSAVVIAKNEVVTNCHVVSGATDIAVIYNGEPHAATAIKPDWRHDLCILTVDNIDAPIVGMRASKALKYEESFFTVGYPDETTKPVSTFGVVKGLFPMDGSAVIRATSPFRLGASGGGAFDDAGNLVGIITLKSKGSQAYYYYMPVEWVQALMLKPAVALTIKSEKPFWAYDEKPYFMRVVYPYLNQDWKGLLAVAKQWTLVEPSSAESWFYLAAAEFGAKDYTSAEAHFQQVLLLNESHYQAKDFLARISAQSAVARGLPRQVALLD